MEIRAEKKTLKNLLGVDDQQFRVPAYQRPYAWTDDQVSDLWQDLLDCVGQTHFMGSIVVSVEDEDRPEVVDGQQRLTTLMILLSVLRDEYHARGVAQQVSRIDRRFVADEFAQGDSYYKFRVGDAHWEVFRDFLLASPNDGKRGPDDVPLLDPEQRERCRTVLANWRQLADLVKADLAERPEGEHVHRLNALVKTLMEGFEFVYVQVDNLGDAFLLFETLNDRGLQLSAADLLKSHLVGVIARQSGGDDLDLAAAKWDSLVDNLGPADVNRFLRHYLLGDIPKVKKDGVFAVFKKRIQELGPHKVLDDLSVAAKCYGEFEQPHLVKDQEARQVLTDLQTLRATSCYIALLPARRYLSDRDFVDFARLAEVLTYRYSSVVGLGTNELERKYHDAAKILNDSRGRDVAAARHALAAVIPDSEQFVMAFQRASMGRKYLVSYTLRRIEESLTPGEKVHDSTSLVHIEHIMPQRLSPGWQRTLGRDGVTHHPEYVHRWGNLTLLHSNKNIPASNKTFAEKKPYYRKSHVEITKALASLSSWGPMQIEKRQRELAAMADLLWRVPEMTQASDATAQSPSAVADALATFREQTGDLWPMVQPLCVECTPEEIREIATSASEYLSDHGEHRDRAQRITRSLTSMLDQWKELDGAERQVLSAAYRYFVDDADAQEDAAPGGLDDDLRVVMAACTALGRPNLAP